MAKIEIATVESVDLDNWTLTVKTGVTERVLDNVTIGALHTDINKGSTFSMIPETGSLGYVMFPDDNEDEPTWLAGKMPYNFAEGYRGGRPEKDEIEEGDAIIRTTGGSELLVKRNGDIVIGGGEGAARRIYKGRTDSIMDMCGNYVLATKGGVIEWRKNKISPLETGASPVTLAVSAKKTEMDPFPWINLEIGNIENEPQNVIKLSLSAIPGMDVSTFKHTVDMLGNVIEQVMTKKIIANQIITEGLTKLGSESAMERVLKGNTFKDLFLNHTHYYTWTDSSGSGHSSGPGTTIGVANPTPYTDADMLAALSRLVYVAG